MRSLEKGGGSISRMKERQTQKEGILDAADLFAITNSITWAKDKWVSYFPS